MRRLAALACAVACLAWALAGCSERADRQGDTTVLGGSAPEDARDGGRVVDTVPPPIPAPPVPPGVQPQLTRSGKAAALAVWVQDGHVVASSLLPAGGGWSTPQPLEDIYGEASDPRLAGNREGEAMAVWRHTVGSIRSLRFSRFAPGSGWSRPDVLPGALPRTEGSVALQMDAQGNVLARWPSGFSANEVQAARHVQGQGWSPAHSEQVAASPPAPAASPQRRRD